MIVRRNALLAWPGWCERLLVRRRGAACPPVRLVVTGGREGVQRANALVRAGSKHVAEKSVQAVRGAQFRLSTMRESTLSAGERPVM